MARSVVNGAFSPPPLSSATSQANGSTKLNVVSRLAIEGKAKQNLDGATVKLYLKLTIPHESVSPSQVIPLFAEESSKLRNYQVHPIDSDSAPYNFSLKENPLLHSAARALNLPARSSQSYLSFFNGMNSSSSMKDSLNSSVVPELEQKYTGYFVVSGYYICFVLPKEFPPMFRKRSSSTDSDGDIVASRHMYGSFIKGRRSSLVGKPSMQFIAALELWIPFASKPAKAPYLVTIPLPRCLSNTIRFRLFTPNSLATSFASLSSDEDSSGWDVATIPHVNRTSLKHSTRTNSYSTLADDESSESSLQSVFENCLIQGTFTSTERICIRWASPLRNQLFPEQSDGRRRARVDRVGGNMTCTILNQSEEGVKMRLDYQGSCSNVWFPGVATMLGLDIVLECHNCSVAWPTDADNERGWKIDSDSAAMSGFNIGSEHRPLSRQPSLELPTMMIPGASHSRQTTEEDVPLGPIRSASTASLLRIPIPSQATTEYSFEDSPLMTPATSNLPSSIASLTPSMSQSSLALAMASEEIEEKKPPSTPITLHLNMNDIQPSERNTFTFNVSGTIVVSRLQNCSTTSSSILGSIDLPSFHVVSSEDEEVDVVVRNQTDDTNVEVHNSYSGGSTISQDKLSHRSKKIVLPVGAQARCDLQGTEILIRPSRSQRVIKSDENTPTLAQSVRSSPVPGPLMQLPKYRQSQATLRRDGPLVIPWLKMTVTPLIRPIDKEWSYAVTFSMPVPLDTKSDWLQFGLGMPLEDSPVWHGKSGMLIPIVDIACASVNGVPVRFETFGKNGKDKEDDISPLLDVLDTGRRDWLAWTRVSAATQGTLEVVYIISGDMPHEIGKCDTEDALDVHLFLPQLSLPVARLQLNVDSPTGSMSKHFIAMDHYSSPLEKFHDFNVQAYATYDLILRSPHRQATTLHSHLRWSRVFLNIALALLGLLLIFSTSHIIGLRRDLVQIYDELQSLGLRHGNLSVDPLLSSVSTTRIESSSGFWWPTGATPQLSSLPTVTDSEHADVPVQSPESLSEESYVSIPHNPGTSPLLPALYIPFSWPFEMEYEEVKRQMAAGWGKVWRVLEIILHWPLPVVHDAL